MKLRFLCFYFFLLLVGAGAGCKDDNKNATPTPTEAPSNPATPAYNNLTIATDKAIYNPNDNVTFTINVAQLPAGARVRYKYLNQVVGEEALASNTWTWKAPAPDFRGYIVEIYSLGSNTETLLATTAVDVSSEWTKFPRYGFLSKFPQLSDEQVNAVMANLNRHHINGIQFYDWHHEHHEPLPVVGGTPANSWKDIINRDIYFSTVEKYINSAHSFNMKAMQYNLIYGVWDNAEADGVNREWFIYKDNTRTNRDFHPLPTPPFLSNIYLVDPSNTGWQQYLINQNKKVYQHLDFDGFHMDQLGDRGVTYKHNGIAFSLAQTYKPFINAVKADTPGKYAVLNAVNQYGQQGIAESASDFLYSEVWGPFDTYNDLANIIKQNNSLSNNTKNSVLAAYMNYDLSNNQGVFNTASVLMTNAVIFAHGGAHLELGEHMLSKEYFPHSNLEMKQDLKTALQEYYDFLVGYQNLLRDGGTLNTVTINSLDNKLKPAAWPAATGSVATFGRRVGDNQVIHLINFNNSKTQNWRDNNGIQTAPIQVKDAKLSLTATGTVKKIWTATPDIIGGASRTINFTQNGNQVSFTLPELNYWSMVVVEY
ncbi:endo-dextranase [Pontibacter beigongshangensis]|uniref:glycoside hydrolase family 66 protein n=1 Tax=Pontibacter beigongshangensis TaxID=2574733 RepID=UPI00164EFDD8|nr:glycoside hydrolase family 66 protein [Pontibacter beigongshangensis]